MADQTISSRVAGPASPALFGRDQELDALRAQLNRGKSLLLCGPAGVGKTALLLRLLPELPALLYCGDSSSTRDVFERLGAALETQQDAYALSCARTASARPRSAVARNGIVIESLRRGAYGIVLDHLQRPSQRFAAAIKDMARSTGTPVIAVARSAHMEDVGFLLPLYPDRGDRFEVRPFDRGRALAFAAQTARRAGLTAANLEEFLERAAELSGGIPGAILAMLGLAQQPHYRSGDHIKVTPLYLDLRMGWEARPDGRHRTK